jgi:gliding motility-associated lipoprotein GldB
MNHKILLPIVLVLLFISCKQNRLKINTDNIEVAIHLERFDELLFNTEQFSLSQKISDACEQHPDFCKLYFEDIVQLGPPDSAFFENNLLLFINDTVYQKVAKSVLETFSDFETHKNEIETGFKHYKYYFPQKPVPDLYTYFSGFNESLIIAEDFIGLSLENYLGANCEFYQYLGIPKYKTQNMVPQKIVPDIFYAWAITEFPFNENTNNLLSNMVYQGKLLYFTEAMNPNLPDSIIIGYTSQQLNWCKQNEANMWAYLAEKRLLYNSERLELRKYIGDGPFTNTFSHESPGRTGVWLGWQIVRSYMNKNRNTSLTDLMEINNAQEILNNSAYFPE